MIQINDLANELSSNAYLLSDNFSYISINISIEVNIKKANVFSLTSNFQSRFS